jgi:hypothetical protein
MANSNYDAAITALKHLNDDKSPQTGGGTGSPATVVGTRY